jgi:hypothetical protein
VRNEKPITYREEENEYSHTIKKATWTDHILLRNSLLKYVTEGKIYGSLEVKRRRGKRRKQLLNDLKKSRGY